MWRGRRVSRAALIVCAAMIFMALVASYQFGLRKGYAEASNPERDRTAAEKVEEASWSEILNAVAADDACNRIREIVLEDAGIVDLSREDVSPHNQ